MTQIESVANLLEYLRAHQFTAARGRWVFRGHADGRYKLLSSVGRNAHTSDTRARYEESMFNMFRRESQGYLPSVPGSDWDWLALAQHHGLPTRLLDWTYNPL